MENPVLETQDLKLKYKNTMNLRPEMSSKNVGALESFEFCLSHHTYTSSLSFKWLLNVGCTVSSSFIILTWHNVYFIFFKISLLFNLFILMLEVRIILTNQVFEKDFILSSGSF